LTTKKIKYFVFAILPLMLSGCIGLNHLKENEKLLYRQGVQAPKEIDTERLHELYGQKANRKILGLPLSPLVSIYYFGANRYDQEKFIKKRDRKIKKYDQKIANTSSLKKINAYQFRKQKKVNRLTKIIDDGNLWMQWGEPVAIYDSTLVKLTTERFHDYLFSKGYFKNKVTSKELIIGKLASVSYRVEPGRPYTIDSIAYQISDTTILHLIEARAKQSYLVKGEHYDQTNFTNEQERIDLLLKDNGYYGFSRQYIEFNIDTVIRGDRKVSVIVIVKEPSKLGYHKQFKVDTVIFTTDAGVKVPGISKRQRQIHRNITYSFFERTYNLKILSQRVFVFPEQLYSRNNTITTQRQLANLDAFKFVNINYDTSGGKFVANIFTSPLERYQWSNEAGVNVTQGFPGPFDNLTFKKRNVFHGLETFELTGRFGFEGVASATDDKDIYTSTEAGVNASLTFPQFLWPFRDKTQIKLGRYNPKTKLSSGYSYTSRPEYKRTTTSINYNYSWENGKSRRFDFTLASLSIIDSDILDPDFQYLLDTLQENQGNNLKLSFNRSFVSSMIFGMTWNHNNYGNKERNSAFLRWQFESGGTLQNFFNYSFLEKNNLQSYKYLRASIDYRKNIVINKNTILAYRLNGGVAYSYDTAKVLPYEKYFFAGGSNSVRAWRPRRLGEGSLKPRVSKNQAVDGLYNYSFEKPGDILMEASIELRKHIVGFIEGAVFLDAGNVWYMFPQQNKTNVTNPGNAQFKLNTFFKEFGVGTGFGFRFDFTFLIIRLDVGMPVYDPAQNEGSRYVLDRVRFFKPYATKNSDGEYQNHKIPVNYNFQIGYPF
jgi:outer membrane protein assembly factor BamA